jgi:endoglucanase
MYKLWMLAAVAGWWAVRSPAEAVCTSLRGSNKWFAADNMWFSRNHRLYYGVNVFELKGINWHGMESDCRVVHGLWENPLDFYMDLLKTQNFNAIRVPLSLEIMQNLELELNPECTRADPAAGPGTTTAQFIGRFLDTAQSRGMFVLFDLHTVGGEITEMPWTADVSEEDVVAAWRNFAETFGKHPAIVGLEIKNEPHGPCSTPLFHRHAAKVIQAIGKTYEGLYFIDGTASSPIDQPPWGGSFESIAARCEDDDLCVLGLPQRLVFAPHVYGPDVRGPTVSVETEAVFERRYGFLTTHSFFNESAIVVTEFGGCLSDKDLDYFKKWKDYSSKKNLSTGAFFWTLPPSSADTGGILLDDYKTLNTQKLDFLNALQPSPSLPCA